MNKPWIFVDPSPPHPGLADSRSKRLAPALLADHCLVAGQKRPGGWGKQNEFWWNL